MNSAKREKYDAAFNPPLRKSSTSSRDLRRIFPIVFNTLTHTTNQGIKLAVFLLFICLLIYPPKLFAKALDLRQVISKVLLVNQKPAFKLINPQSVDEGRALQFILEASDPDGSACDLNDDGKVNRSEEHTSELQSQSNLLCRLLLEKNSTCPGSEQSRVPGIGMPIRGVASFFR